MTALGVTQLSIGSYNYDLPDEGADDTRQVNRNVIGASGKFDAFGKDWTWDAYFQNGYSRSSVRVTNTTYRDRFNLALQAVRNPTTGTIVCASTLLNPTNGCVPWDEMGTGVNTDQARKYLLGTSYLYQHLTENVWEATLQGEPIEIWAGPVSVSANIAHREEKVNGINDPDSQATNWFAGNYKVLTGHYDVTEGALETVVPLAKGTSWADNWDLNAAARFTDYSTSGYVTTWKVGTTYAPIPDIKFRLTQSRDIRAPNLNELFAAGTGSQVNLGLDRFTGTSPQYRGLAVGNPGLKPESADTSGIGVVLSPRFIEGLTLSVDYWNIALTGAITPVSAQNEVDLCFQNGPTDPNCGFITRTTPTGVAPYATIGQIIQIQTTSINVAHQNESGIDFEGSYRWDADKMVKGWAGKFVLHGNATLYLRNYTNPGYPGAVLTDTVGENRGSGPPNWRTTVNFSYDLDPITTTLTARGISSGVYSNNNIVCTTGCPAFTAAHDTINFNNIAGAWYFDASVNYKFGIGDNVQSEAFINVRNLANKYPAQVAFQSIQYIVFTANTTLYDTLGRVFRAGVRFKM